MDISTKKWRVRSSTVVLGHTEITETASGQSRYIPNQEIPTQHTLTMCKEADFDRMIARAFGS